MINESAAAFADRLASAFEGVVSPIDVRGRAKWLQANMSERFGIAIEFDNAFSWVTGRQKPDWDQVVRIAELLEVDVTWLEQGVGH